MDTVIIREATPCDYSAIIALSQNWATEDITFGYTPCTLEILHEYRVWCAVCNQIVIGYLLGQRKVSKDICVIPIGTVYFEVEDLYVIERYRSKGVGKFLFSHVEQALRSEQVDCILLSTATKDYKRILRFYTESLGLTVWTTTLFKAL